MFFIFLLMLAAVWLLWNISRNTSDALDKQTALQYELVALEKRMDELADVIRDAVSQGSPGHTEVATGPVNINTASATELATLPKVGRTTAQRIISARPFANPEELTKVQGISEEIFQELKARIVV